MKKSSSFVFLSFLVFTACGQSGSSEQSSSSGQPGASGQPQNYHSVSSMVGNWTSSCMSTPSSSTVPYMTRSFNFDQNQLIFQAYNDSTCTIPSGGSIQLSAAFSFGSVSTQGTAFTYSSTGMRLRNTVLNGISFATTPGNHTTIQFNGTTFTLVEDPLVVYSSN